MIEYTGHPLYDVGVATMTAFVDKDNPQDLTEADLDEIAEYLIYEYTHQPLKSFATVPFGGGAYFTQPAYKGKPTEIEGTQKILKAYKAETPTLAEQCVFTGKAAVAIQLDEKGVLPIGRAARSNIPLITGADIINFHPYGDVGLPVSGEALLAIHAMPLGSAKSRGRLLMVHSDNKELMVHFAQKFLEQNQQAISMARTEGSTKIKEADYSYRTLLIHTLLPARVMQLRAKKDDQPFSVTAYHLSNSGQDPSLDIYHLPLQVMGFLREMMSQQYQKEWNLIVNRAWDIEPPKKKAKPFKHYRNFLYEDLFELPDQASRFIRTYFLRIAWRYAKKGATDPRDSYSTKKELSLVSWEITATFLRRIMHMEKEKIEAIKQMGDTLAEYVNNQNDQRFFREFFMINNYYALRNRLIKTDLTYTKQGHPPIITYDAFVTIFEEGEETFRKGWWQLARDLILIRMIERLHELGNWLKEHPEAIPDEDEEQEEN